ncbi:RHS repeat-associated core domain-containing protein [Myceligenerans halotolerans]
MVVAALVSVLVATDPAAAGPVTAQIVRTAIATVVETRDENWDEAQVELPDTLASDDLPEPAVEPLTSKGVPEVEAATAEGTSNDGAAGVSGAKTEAPTAATAGMPTAAKAAMTGTTDATKSATSAVTTTGTAATTTAATATTAAATTAATTATATEAGAVAGEAGSWTATPFSRTSKWSAGGSTGAFSWSYPIGLPPVASGPMPQVSLGYSSAGADGRVAGENNQTSGIGEGWDITQGYVERRFTPCSQDTDPVDGAEPNNADHPTGDLCMDTDNAIMMLNGASTELVKDEASGAWRPKNDDGTRIQHLTGADNGDQKRDGSGTKVAEGEYWKVTTTDGTQYVFGQTVRPEDGKNLYSGWVVPVYGNHPGEQCYVAGDFAASRCNQVWRWNLDRVIAPTGGTMTYTYAREWGRYGYNENSATTTYVRGGHLAKIEYGTQLGDESAPPARVMFDRAGRCLEGSTLCDPADRAANPDRWPDVPSHLECDDTSSCLDVQAPVFFSTQRIFQIRTQTRTTSGSYLTVDEYDFRHEWIDPHDGSLGELGAGKILWLAGIRRTGMGADGDGSDDVRLPWTEFAYTMLANRVDSIGDGAPEMFRPRMTAVRSELGSVTSISYAPATCTPSNIPGEAATQAEREGEGNRRRCFPVKWHNDEYAQWEPVERIDWFHKYVVESINDNGQGPAGVSSVESAYQYDSAGPVWVKPTGPLVDPDEATYSEYRGFATSTTRTGDGTDGPRTKTVTKYYQGVNGKTLTASSLPAGEQITATDREHFAGRAFATTVYDGSTPVSTQVTVPARSAATATAEDGTTARRTTSTTTDSFTFTAAGALEHHTRSKTYLDDYGQVERTDDQGDVTTSADDRCTRISFARNPGKHLMSTAYRTETVSVGCDATPSRPADVISDTRVYYDEHTSLTASPDKGLVTKTERIDPDDGVGYEVTGTVAYDTRGRQVEVTDALGRSTSTVYTEDAAGRPTRVVKTSPDPDGAGALSAHVTSVDVAPGTGVVSRTVDANGKVTQGSHDDLGRVLDVTYPQHADLGSPSITYEYTIGTTTRDGQTVGNGRNAVVTSTLGADGSTRHFSSELYDGLARQVQTQAEAADAGDGDGWTPDERGRVITHTLYDSAGRASKVMGPWHRADGVVSATPLDEPVLGNGDVLAYATTEYDGASRPVAEVFWTGTTSNPEHEEWRTVTRYDGAYTTVLPPKGGTPTTAVVDGRGRTTHQWQHLNRPDITSGSFDTRSLAASTYQDTTYSYDHAGRLAGMTDPAGNDWSYEYDWAGQEISATDPDAGTSTTTYDAAGQVVSVTNGAGEALGYTYDALGRQTSLRDGSPTGAVRASWTYDQYVTGPYAGDLVKGVTTASTRHDSTGQYVTSVDEVDEAYRPTSTTLTLPQATELGALAGQSYTSGTQYMADGQVSQVTHPAVGNLGPETITTYYDSASMPAWMGGGFGWGVYVANTRFTAFGEMAKLDLGNTYGATATYQYDAGTRRLANIGLYREDVIGSELDLSYTYDEAGNVLSQADRPDAAHMAAQHDTQCYSYDILNRLTQAWTPGNGDCSQDAFTGAMGGAAPYWTEWEFDQVGNRTRQLEHAPDGVATITAYEHGQGLGVDGAGPHAVTGIDVTTRATDGSETTVGAEYAYDDAGRMTVRQHADGSEADALGWDAESELADVTTGSAERGYVYDADGTRLVRFLNDNVYVTLPGGSEVFLKKTTGVIQTTRYYQFAGQTVAMRDGAGLGGVMSMVNDHHGTVVARVPNTNPATDAVERTYTDPYGNLRGGSWAPGPRGGFLGEFRDSTGLTLLGARYYDPQLGRFITVDPILDLTDPQQWHGYAYSHSNPTTYSDPAGLREFASDTLHGDTQDEIRAAVEHTHGPGSGGRSPGGGSDGGGTSKPSLGVETVTDDTGSSECGRDVSLLEAQSCPVTWGEPTQLQKWFAEWAATPPTILEDFGFEPPKECTEGGDPNACAAWEMANMMILAMSPGGAATRGTTAVRSSQSTSAGSALVKYDPIFAARNAPGSPIASIPSGASVRTLKPHPGAGSQNGVEFKFKNAGGTTVRVRVHDADGTAPTGSNAASGVTYRVQIGARYMDARGNLYPKNVHNAKSPHYDPAAANATHIPWPSHVPLPW